MNKEVKAKWVAALRSGEYKQTRGVLQHDDSFCCLGVLCDLYSQENGGMAVYDLANEDGEQLPCSEVVMWAGIPAANPAVSIDGRVAALSDHNDSDPLKQVPGRTFAEIAKAIEEQL